MQWTPVSRSVCIAGVVGPAPPTLIVKSFMTVVRFIVVLLGMLLVGCDPVARESIKVRLASASEAETAKDALALIDQVMKENEFRPSTLGPQVSDPTLVATYGDAVETTLGCVVFHRRGEIEIEFVQMGRFRLSPQGTRAKVALRGRLVERFGRGEVSP